MISSNAGQSSITIISGAFAVMLIICMFFMVVTFGNMLYNKTIDKNAREDMKELDDKLTQIKNNKNISFTQAATTAPTFTSIEPQTLAEPEIPPDANIFRGFNNTGSYNPGFESKPNDKFGIGL